MKKIYFILFLAVLPFISQAQCFVQVQSNNVSCFGGCDGSANAFPVGTGPYNWFWQPSGQTTQNVTGLCAGSYTVIMIDMSNNCTATQTVTISQPTQIIVATSSTSASCASCCDGSAVVTASGGTSPYTYLWMPGNLTGPMASNLCPGTYTCCVTDANGCISCSSTTVSFTTGIQDQSANGNLSLFPNPAVNFVNVKESFTNPVNAEISVIDVLGKTLVTRVVSGQELNENFDLSSFTKGVYFISVKSGEGTSIQKFVKE